MADPRPLPVIFFRTKAGNEPARVWLKGLPADERRMIGEDLKTLQFRWPLGMPLVRSLGDCPVPFHVAAGRIVVLHGFIKKTQKTPPEEKALALKRKNEHDQAEKS